MNLARVCRLGECVFIDDQLVIDISGTHTAVEQSVHLDRVQGLVDGQKHTLRFFFAERHRTQSNFRIETNFELRPASTPNSAAMYD